MVSSSSSISINCNIFLYSIELFNDDVFVEKFSPGNRDLKVYLPHVFKAPCEAPVKLLHIRQEKKRCRNERDTGMGIFLSLIRRTC